jgi:hypothetical protein
MAEGGGLGCANFDPFSSYSMQLETSVWVPCCSPIT